VIGARLREARQRDPQPSVDVRVGWLTSLADEIQRRRDALCDAVRADLNKPEFETDLTEVNLCRDEARFAARHLAAWARPRRVGGSLLLFPARSALVPEPRGVVAVFGTWNYPIRLALGPVIAALAAGNRVLLKPSERAPHTGAALAELLRAAVGDDVVESVVGDVETAKAILRERFDLFFYTGGPGGARAVMRSAAEHLVPVVLEMGGKSPAIIHASANWAAAVERIAWGKFLNAGQTCVAPDYVCVPRDSHDRFVADLTATLQRFYPDGGTLARDYSRTIDAAHFDRLVALAESPRTVSVGTRERERLLFPPTLLPGAGWRDPAMQEEVFGPVLPIVPYEDYRTLLATISARPSPLALYVFAEDVRAAELARVSTRSGAFMVNDTIRHLSNFNLPFGGVGESGFGRYHGWFGFETFSHFRPVVSRSSRFRMFDVHPPYGPFAERVRRFFR
jgi:aldehyde dehydrogenase (NAD+)